MRICYPAVAIALTAAAPARADVIKSWNEAAVDVALAQKWSSARASRNLAMVQLAVFDAVNAVQPAHRPYRYRTAAAPGASAEAAASEAAFKVLSALAPDQATTLQARNANALAEIADPAARDAGIAAGDGAAAAILADREADGLDDSPGDPPPARNLPGVYEPTAPGPLFAPHFPQMRPFGFADSSQFRLPPPPPLDSPQFQRDLAEVRRVGDAHASPTAEQLSIARFHAPAGFVPWNAIARQAASRGGMSLSDEARAFAVLAVTMCDTFEASFESKNTYGFWRPQTAIRYAGDASWTSLIQAPPFAEYPCMHCAIGASAQTVMETLFPADAPFTITNVNGLTRSFRNVRQYAEEEAESRILGGVHYRWSAVAGDALGRSIALFEMDALP